MARLDPVATRTSGGRSRCHRTLGAAALADGTPDGARRDLLRRAADRRAARPVAAVERPAVTDGAERATWAELDGGSAAAALALRRRGLTPATGSPCNWARGSTSSSLYLGALRAGLVAVPVNPAYTERRGRAHPRRLRRRAAPGPPRAPATLLARRPAGAGTPGPRPRRARSSRYCSTRAARAGAPGARCSRPAPCWRTSTSSAAVEPPLLTAGDVLFVPVAADPHLRAERRAGHGAATSARPCVLADRFDAAQRRWRRWRPNGSPRCSACPASTRPGSPTPASPTGSRAVRFAMSGSATLGRGVVDGFAAARCRRPRRVRADRGRARRRDQRPGRAAGTGRRSGRSGWPLPGVEVELRDAEGDPVDDGDPGRLVRPRRQPVLRLLARRRRRPGRRTAGSAPATSRSADDAGQLRLVGRSADLVDRQRLQRLPGRGRDGPRRRPGRGRGRRRRRPDDPRTGEAVRAYVVPATGADAAPGRAARGGRAVAGPVQAADARSRSSTPLPRTVTGKIMKWQLDREARDGSD